MVRETYALYGTFSFPNNVICQKIINFTRADGYIYLYTRIDKTLGFTMIYFETCAIEDWESSLYSHLETRSKTRIKRNYATRKTME